MMICPEKSRQLFRVEVSQYGVPACRNRDEGQSPEDEVPASSVKGETRPRRFRQAGTP